MRIASTTMKTIGAATAVAIGVHRLGVDPSTPGSITSPSTVTRPRAARTWTPPVGNRRFSARTVAPPIVASNRSPSTRIATSTE